MPSPSDDEDGQDLWGIPVRVVRYHGLGKSAPEELPIFRAPAPSDAPSPDFEAEWKRRQQAQTPIKMTPENTPEPPAPTAPAPQTSGGGLLLSALLAGAALLL